MAKLTHDFFNGDTVAIAQALLGKYLVRNRNGELLAGRITETEAYVGRCDKACHAYNYRRTPRTETLKERMIKMPHWKSLKSHFRNSVYGMRY